MGKTNWTPYIFVGVIVVALIFGADIRDWVKGTGTTPTPTTTPGLPPQTGTNIYVKDIRVLVQDDLNTNQTGVTGVYFFTQMRDYRVDSTPAATDDGWIYSDTSSTFDLIYIDQTANWSIIKQNGFVCVYVFDDPLSGGTPGATSADQFHSGWMKIPIAWETSTTITTTRNRVDAYYYTIRVPSLALSTVTYSDVSGNSRKAVATMSTTNGKANPAGYKKLSDEVTAVIFGSHGLAGDGTYYLVTFARDASTAPSSIDKLYIETTDFPLIIQSAITAGNNDWYYVYIPAEEIIGEWDLRVTDSDGIWQIDNLNIYWGYAPSYGAPQALTDDMCSSSYNDTS